MSWTTRIIREGHDSQCLGPRHLPGQLGKHLVSGGAQAVTVLCLPIVSDTDQRDRWALPGHSLEQDGGVNYSQAI